jgi:hypothetical protein
MTHTLSAPAAFSATEAGALPGHEVRCSCGFVARTSLSAAVAQHAAAGHVAYMASRGTAAKPRRVKRVNPWER